jgi:hypothetical protein
MSAVPCLMFGIVTAEIRMPVFSEAPPMPCNYSVAKQPVGTGSGHVLVPEWLNGTYFHAVYRSNILVRRKPVCPELSGVLSIAFNPDKSPTASFEFVKGTCFNIACGKLGEAGANGTTTAHGRAGGFTNFVGSSAVTLSSACGDQNICAVSAFPEAAVISADSLVTSAEPAFTGSLGPRQTPYPAGFGPSVFSPGHMPTDADRRSYGIAYIHAPTPAYRLYRVAAPPSRSRQVLADLPVTPQGNETNASAPAYNHQCVAITPSFLIIPEMPTRMPRWRFDWGAIQKSWIPDGKLFYLVVDKETGELLARFWLPPLFTWHNVNAFENASHVSIDAHFQAGPVAFNAFTNLPANTSVYDWHGSFARVTFPNPRAPGAPTEGPATMVRLSSAIDVTPEFGTTNPEHLWQRPARFVWALATDDASRNLTFLPNLIRIDTAATDPDGSVLRWSSGGHFGLTPPMFVPEQVGQSADSAAGVVVTVAVSRSGDAPALLLLDGQNLTLLANLTLPVAPLEDTGLHNHFSLFPRSV